MPEARRPRGPRRELRSAEQVGAGAAAGPDAGPGPRSGFTATRGGPVACQLGITGNGVALQKAQSWDLEGECVFPFVSEDCFRGWPSSVPGEAEAKC